MNFPRRLNIDNRLLVVGIIAAVVVALLACTFLVNLISRGAIAFIPLAAGALLLAGNVREGLSLWRLRQAATPVMNAMIGLSLIFFSLGVTIFGGSLLRILFYGPALALLLLALPMAIGRPGLYSSYGQWARRVGQSVGASFPRRGRGASAPPHSEAQSPRSTVELDQQDIAGGVTQQDPQRKQR